MEKNYERPQGRAYTLAQPSSSQLRGRQSVRATFRLSEKAIDAISILALHMGIKQKSLFDQLLDDAAALEVVARKVREDSFEPGERVQKTYVLSRSSLSCLERISIRSSTPRDALVEYSVRRLLPLIRKERLRHRKRRDMLKYMTAYLEQGKDLLALTEKELGREDPVYELFSSAMHAVERARAQAESMVEKGEVIENF